MPKLAEWHIYGNEQQGRFAIKKPETEPLYYLSNLTNNEINKNFFRILDKKQYDIKDHLGNVRVTFGDTKLPTDIVSSTRGISPFFVDEKSVQDYYPGGMVMRDRSLSSSDSRYGYNGQEKSLEIDIYGNHHTAEFWEVDNRILRRWNLDPVLHEWRSDYSIFGNNPILLNDPDGDDTPLGDFDTGGGGFLSGIGDALSSAASAIGSGLSSAVNAIGSTANSVANTFSSAYNNFSGNGYINDANRFCDDNGISRDLIKYETTIEIQSDGSEKDLGQKFASVQKNENGAITSHNFYKGGYRNVRSSQYDVANAYLRNGKENPFFRGDGLEDNNLDFYFGASAGKAILKVAASRIAANASAKAATNGVGLAEKVFLSENFGITSEKFANSITGVKGTWNTPGGLFKMGWSTQSKYGGGMQLRIGIGSKVGNTNQAWKHIYIPKTFVPNSFANPSIQLKKSLFNPGN
jgi:hypothetical protein